MKIEDFFPGMKISLIKMSTNTPDNPDNLLAVGECVDGILLSSIKEKEPIKITKNNLSKEDFITSPVIQIYDENDAIFIDTTNSTFKVENLD